MILRSFLVVEQFGVENVELVALHCFGRRVVFVVVHRVVLVPLDCHSPPIYVLRLLVSEPAFSLAGHPVVELFFVFFQPLVLLELDDLLGNVVDGDCGVVDDGCTEEVVAFGQRQSVL